MPVYLCRVADDAGKIEELVREAASEESILREQSSAHLYVLSVRELSAGDGGPRAGRRFSRREVDDLTDHLTLMLGSGLSLKDSLEVAQSVSPHGSGLVALLLAKIRKGTTFAAALEDAGQCFPPVYRGMVRIGERIGCLDQVFARLSSYRGERKRLRERFAAALLYPAMVTGVALAAAVLILTVLFPRLREVFAQIGPGMAGPVDALMRTLTTGLFLFGGLLAAGIVFVVVTVRARRQGSRIAARIDAFLLRIPVVSSFIVRNELLNFAFAMESLTASGVSVDDALLEAAGAMGNMALRGDVTTIREKVRKGERLSAACAASRHVPAHVSRWAGIGERVGHVEKVFAQLRAYYEREVEKWMHRFMTLIEPAFIAALGIVIVLFVVLFIIPLLSLYGTIL